MGKMPSASSRRRTRRRYASRSGGQTHQMVSRIKTGRRVIGRLVDNARGVLLYLSFIIIYFSGAHLPAAVLEPVRVRVLSVVFLDHHLAVRAVAE